jgi:hypothetical protein
MKSLTQRRKGKREDAKPFSLMRLLLKITHTPWGPFALASVSAEAKGAQSAGCALARCFFSAPSGLPLRLCVEIP